MVSQRELKNAIQQASRCEREHIIQLVEEVTKVFKKESRLIHLPESPLIFIGDTHGDWTATQALLTKYWETPVTFVFLGDYVDRGPYQIENISLLYELKRQAPNRLILLRGNHETPSVNYRYGFYFEVKQKLGDLYHEYSLSFAEMPLAAKSSKNRIFAVHGGLSENLNLVKEINALPREEEVNHPVSFQMLWNDPQEHLRGFAPSMRGGNARAFGRDVTEQFLKQNNLELIVRAHEVFLHGFHRYFDNLILSLFSCRDYGKPIDGKALYIDNTGTQQIIPV
ncbi:MAG: metallophosphoesterase [Promethearchaeota archaeon]